MSQSTQSQPNQPIERQFRINGLNIAAKEWHPAGQTKAIALHGWLDNANSFDKLAPLLPAVNTVAIDCPGQGKSDFRSADAPYLIWSEAAEVIQLADQLGWDEFVLIGHSRGANISSIIAGTFPDRVSHLVLIDGGIPSSVDSLGAPAQLAESIIATQHLSGTKGTLFDTHERAIMARSKGFLGIDIASAEAFAERSLIKEDGGYRWRADSRLKAPSAWKLSEENTAAFFSRMTMPTLLVQAADGMYNRTEVNLALLENIKALCRVILPGAHHLHMEGAEVEIAAKIVRLLSGASA